MSVTKSKPFDVIFYIYYKELETLGPYLYGIRMWHERGYDVSVYSLAHEKNYLNLPDRFRKYFKHHTIKFPLWLKICCFGLQGIGFIARIVFRLRTRGGAWAKLFKMSYFSFSCYRRCNKEQRQILIGADPPGLWAAALTARKTSNPYIYFVKEMFLSGDARNLFDRIIKCLEKKANKNAMFTVEFDETRAGFLREDNGLSAASILIIPNAPLGKPNPERSRYFREMFGIGEDMKIALYTGGIADYNLTYEHITSMETWPENVVLVMHCWGREEEMGKLKNFASRFSREIYFSTKMLPFNEVEKIYSSSDIGFALYGDQDLNHKYAGMSSGKLFSFMKACVPIITNNSPSCKKAIEETGCGICIGEMSEIGNAIQQILERESEFRANCERNFPTFSFESNYLQLMKAVECHAGIVV